MCSRDRRLLSAVCAALLASCGPASGPIELVPAIESIEPTFGYAQADTPVVLRGSFPVRVEASYSGDGSGVVDASYRAWVGAVELREVTRLDATTATAVVPAGVAPGVHALAVESPFRTRATLEAAFTVRDAVLTGVATVPPRVSVGQQATLTLVVGNAGSVDVRGVAPTLDVFAGAPRLSGVSADPAAQDVPAGGNATFTWTFTGASAGAVELGVDASGTEAVSGAPQTMPRVTAAFTVQAPPRLAFATPPSVAPATATVGQEITVTAEVRNDGEATAAGVLGQVSSPSFAGLGAPIASPAAHDIAGGASATFTWTYRPTAATAAGGVALSVGAEGTDANSGAPVAVGPAATNVLLVNPPAQVSALLEAPAEVTSGQEIAVTLTVTNSGAAPADVTPTLDDPVATGSAGVTPAAGSTLPTARVPGGATQVFGWTFASRGAGAVEFAARAAWDDVNSRARGTANTAPVTVRVLAPGALVVQSATPAPALVAAGGNVTVDAVVENLGESMVTGVTATITAAPGGFTLLGEPPPAQDVPGGATSNPFTFTYRVEAGAEGGTFTVEVAGIEQHTQIPVSAPPVISDAVRVGYPVGGSVAGLAGTGLVLRNGSELLPVPRGATGFTFATPVASGAGYEVTVATQPSDPTQACAVVAGTGSGTVGAAPVTTVAVSCTTSAFTLGGTVSGLAGTGLVLRNGGETVTLDPGDTAFEFPTALESGTGYAVTVDAQPTGPTQRCEVTLGSGTVVDANVTSVRVTCATLSFTVGGTVSGLEGDRLQLRITGGETLQFNGAGAPFAFTFDTQIPSGETYEVTVVRQPTKPTQTCTVANGTGTVGGADVTDVRVTCSTETFSLGGTIDGLLGAGLVLTNGAETLPVSGTGTFTFAFPTELADLTSYVVSVVSQPSVPTQDCDVTNGTGQIDGADVTNVTVGCTTLSFAVGGTVDGLVAGETLVLQNNGVDDLTVTASGAFSFATPIASSATYDVTIATQPARQTCGVLEGGSGVVGAADVTSVVVSCSPPPE